MSYPQPLASQEVIQGQGFNRLFTELDSSGDAYEMDVSAKAFCIGPESDIAKARITYYDSVLAARAQSFVVQVGDPFYGRIDSLPQNKYAGNIASNIIITPEDLVESQQAFVDAFGAGIIDTNFDLISYVKPRIDLLGYLSDPAVLALKRSDYVRRGFISVQNHVAVGFGGNGTTYLFFPYYRRKYVSLKIFNGVGSNYTVFVYGMSIRNATTFDVGVADVKRVQLATAVVGAAPAALEIRASTTGFYDYLGISVAGAGYDSGNAVTPGVLAYDLTITDEEA